MARGSRFRPNRLLRVLSLCAASLIPGAAGAAPLKVVGRFLQDAHGNNLRLRGVNLPVYKSGYADDLDAVAAAIALTKTNAVRLEWWAVPPAGTTEYTPANFNRAIQKFYDLGIIPVVELHDLTFQYGHDAKAGPNSDGNDQALFASTITAFWTRPDVVAILANHQDHIVINLANEWGSSFYSDATPTTANFIQNYTNAITAMRNAGIVAPLMVDAPKGFEYQFLLDHGAALLAADPQHNTLLSAHAYWAATDFPVASVNTILDNFMNSGLPIVLGEASSNAYTNIPCDPINYVNLLTRANTNATSYLFWAWYEDGQCGQDMNITVGADGVTRPTGANPGYGYDALYHPGFGIDTALPATTKADFSPVGPTLLNTSFGYNVTSTNDNATRAATALVTRLDNFGAERRPVVVLMPGWGGAGDVAAARNAQTVMFANQGYVALNIGFHQTSDMPGGAPVQWYSDLAESARAALDVLCLEAYADCAAVALTGVSYGGTQTHPVVRYLRGSGVFDGSGGANLGRKVVAILGQDSGYTLHWQAPLDADATAYSVAMIQNLGDADFPVDSCDFGNCGARNRANYHQTAAGSQFVLSFCPAGGSHGSRGYADWDSWVLSAVKTMLHTQRAVTKFTGYVEPALAVSNACVTNPAGVVSISNVTVAEGNAGSADAVFTVTLGAPSAVTITVSAVTSNLTATAGSDYTATGPLTLTFAPGVVSQPFAVPVLGDLLLEPDETFQVTLSAPTNATIGSGVAIGTIQNDDLPARTFVSSSGSDGADCSAQTTPCRNIAAALIQTATDGEIIILRPGEYETAPLTIARGVKITSPSGTVAFIRQPITIDAPGARVVLRGLTLKGAGAGDAITLSSADSLSIEETTVDRWSTGLKVQNLAATRISILASVFRANATGLRTVPGGPVNPITIEESRFEANGAGIDLGAGSLFAREAAFVGNSVAGLVVGPGSADVQRSEFSLNGTAVSALPGGTVRIGRSRVFANTVGLSAAGGSTLLSGGTNVVRGNGTDTAGAIGAIPEQ